MKPLDDRMLELKAEGRRFREIASELTTEGYQTPHGKIINEGWVSSRIGYISKQRGLSGKITTVNRTLTKRAPRMITMEEPPRKGSGKVVAIIADVADVKEFLKDLL
jgi:hypothetical protein